MNFFPLFFAKILLISGLLYGYYRFCLRNAPFYAYNRYYLLGIMAISLILPLLHIPTGTFFGLGTHPAATGIIHKITTGEWEESLSLFPGKANSPVFFNERIAILALYLLITGIFLTSLSLSIRYILRLSARCPKEEADGISIYLSAEPGTPFSFLNRIFWNSGMDIGSPQGKQVFRHELYHVRQKHTADLLAIECIRALFWWNPFFHLIRKEIKATHEFLADRYAVTASVHASDNASDKFEYAELLVWRSIGNPSPAIVHSFFNTHLKRRIIMLTRSKNTRPGYLSRIMALPLLFLLFCAFAVKLDKEPRSNGRRPLKTITVVIDAGHGGIDPGTHNQTMKEKDLTLAIAKKVQQLSPAYNVHVLMTREEDKMPGDKATIEEGLHWRTDFANEHKADLFISIHANGMAPNDSSYGMSNGMQIYLSPQNAYFQKSASLGSAMIEELKRTYPTEDRLVQRKEGIWVLHASDMPAILIECGNMLDDKDFAFIAREQNQETVARSILQGILRYEESLSK